MIWLSKKEYGEVCKSIRTNNANKIPKWGQLLYKNHFYVYSFDAEEEQILFQHKIKIEGNERLIKGLIKEEENAN